jgi:hypothetical protein
MEWGVPIIVEPFLVSALIKKVMHQFHIPNGNSNGERCFACQGRPTKQRSLAQIQPIQGNKYSEQLG